MAQYYRFFRIPFTLEYIRDINISDNEQDDKMPAANKRLAAMAGDVVN